MSFIYFLLILMGVISIHEVGHYVFAKLFKVRVLEFALGFGPKIYERKGKETSFRVNVFPIGGYVRLAGEDLSEARDAADEHSLYGKPAWQRLLISLAGPLFSIATVGSSQCSSGFSATKQSCTRGRFDGWRCNSRSKRQKSL